MVVDGELAKVACIDINILANDFICMKISDCNYLFVLKDDKIKTINEDGEFSCEDVNIPKTSDFYNDEIYITINDFAVKYNKFYIDFLTNYNNIFRVEFEAKVKDEINKKIDLDVSSDAIYVRKEFNDREINNYNNGRINNYYFDNGVINDFLNSKELTNYNTVYYTWGLWAYSDLRKFNPKFPKDVMPLRRFFEDKKNYNISAFGGEGSVKNPHFKFSGNRMQDKLNQSRATVGAYITFTEAVSAILRGNISKTERFSFQDDISLTDDDTTERYEALHVKTFSVSKNNPNSFFKKVFLDGIPFLMFLPDEIAIRQDKSYIYIKISQAVKVGFGSYLNAFICGGVIENKKE